MFAIPKRHILAQNREFWRILHQNPSRGLGCSELQEPQKTNTFWVCNLERKVTYMQKGNPWANRDELLHRCRGPRPCDVMTSANFYDSRVRGLSVVGGQILGFSIDLKLLIYLRIRVVIASNLLNLVAAAMSENTFLVIELWMLGTVLVMSLYSHRLSNVL